MPKSGYRGALAEPVRLPDHWKKKGGARQRSRATVHFYTPSMEAIDQQKLKDEFARKAPLLFEHFGVDPASADAWEKLAISLAIAHVPGFQSYHAKGRPTAISINTLEALWRAYRRKKASWPASSTPTDAAICRSLATDKTFNKSVPELANAGPRRLQNLLKEASRRRRANIVHRWERRAVRAVRDGSEHMWFGDTPPWRTSSASPFRRK